MIPLFKVYMDKSVDMKLLSTLHSGWIGQGEQVKNFEKKLSLFIGNNNCLTLSAGTHGLHLALRLAGCGTDDEVITTPLTCTATNWPILMQGSKIVWADVKRDDLNIDPEDVRKKITNKTKAIMCVHWGGYPCDLKELHEIAKEYNLVLIEDAAHAFGATYKGNNIGKCDYSDFTMFSFQAIKHLTTVDGGALFSRKYFDMQRGKLLRWYGIDREVPGKSDFRCEDQILEWGYKYHMNDVSASIGIGNLGHVEENLNKCAENVRFYRERLTRKPGIKLIQSSIDRFSSNWLFTILVKDRANFSRIMEEYGIMVSRVHERNDKHFCTSEFKSDLPVVDEVIQEMVCIPCGWWVTKEDREFIIDRIVGGW